jgi:hypothetical protein
MLVPRSRLAGAGSKTPQAALVKSHCGERWGKGMARSMSVRDQRDERKRTTEEVSKIKDEVKTGGYLYTRKSPGETCLLPGRRPA